MISKILKMIFGSRNDRELKRMGKVVKKINAMADEIKALSDEQQAAPGRWRATGQDSARGIRGRA